MHEQSTNQQGGPTNDRNDSSGSGLLGPKMGSGSGREELSAGQNGDRSSGGLHLGLRGLDQVADESSPYLKVLQDIHTAIQELNETIKYKSRY